MLKLALKTKKPWNLRCQVVCWHTTTQDSRQRIFMIYKEKSEINEMVHRLEISEGAGQLRESSYMDSNQACKSPE